MTKRHMWMTPIAGLALTGMTSVAAPAKAQTAVQQPIVQQPVVVRPYKHIFVIMMENEGDTDVIGNPNTPYITKLASEAGYDDNYFGVTHPSLPNYIAAITGNNWYSNSDDPTQTFDHQSLVDQLSARHLTWKGYVEDLPSPGWTGYWYPDSGAKGTSPSTMPSNALYGIKHNPFLLLDQVRNDPAMAKRVVPLTQLDEDLKTGHVPNFAWISPNMAHNMHGQPPGPGATAPYTDMPTLYKAGDDFVKAWVAKIEASKAWQGGNSLIVITWDEAAYPGSSNPSADRLKAYAAPGPNAPSVPSAQLDVNWPGGVYGGGNVPLIFLSSRQKQHVVLHTWANHYNLLRTIEANWKLPYLGMASDSRQVQTLDVFKSR